METDDFWSKMGGAAQKAEAPPAPKELEDWGKEFDKPQNREQNRYSTLNGREAHAYRRDDTMSQGRDDSERKPKYREASPAESETTPASVNWTPSQELGERVSRRHESDRSNRFEITPDEDLKVTKKRSARNSRYENEDADDGMDDSYEEYQDRRRKKAER
jgi:hypothetical protein